MCVCACVRAHVRARARPRPSVRPSVRPSLHAYIHLSIHACIHICVHTFHGSEGCTKCEKYSELLFYRFCKDFIYIFMDHLYIKIKQPREWSVYLTAFVMVMLIVPSHF